jgi:hypothetical protein
MNNYVNDIKQILAQARQKAYSAINAAMVEAYWQIGKRIIEQEQHGENRAAYGEGILKELSKALTAEFGKGFSYANLYNFRQFYLTYPADEIFYTLCRKLTWSHDRLIMRVENPEARSYYLKEAAGQGWSVRTLERNINTFYYQRLLSSQNKQEAIQDSKTLEFGISSLLRLIKNLVFKLLIAFNHSFCQIWFIKRILKRVGKLP